MLYDEILTLDCDLKIYGSPYSPEFNEWAFSLKSQEDQKNCWTQIPDDTDILITHGPPFGILDQNNDGLNCGDEILLKEVQERVKPQLHLFGHIHEAYGMQVINETTYINASTCNFQYSPENKPVVYDI